MYAMIVLARVLSVTMPAFDNFLLQHGSSSFPLRSEGLEHTQIHQRLSYWALVFYTARQGCVFQGGGRHICAHAPIRIQTTAWVWEPLQQDTEGRKQPSAADRSADSIVS